jgi:hypothetical protein
MDTGAALFATKIVPVIFERGAEGASPHRIGTDCAF